MTHKSSHVIISNASQAKFDKLPEQAREKIKQILESANHDIEEVLGEG